MTLKCMLNKGLKVVVGNFAVLGKKPRLIEYTQENRDQIFLLRDIAGIGSAPLSDLIMIYYQFCPLLPKSTELRL